MENPNPREESTATRVVAALVISTTLENFDILKRSAAELGRILYQRTAPPWAKLWIVEHERDGP